MKVKELIELLSQHDEELDIYIYANPTASNYHIPESVYSNETNNIDDSCIVIECYY